MVLVIEEGHPNGRDLVMADESQYIDQQETVAGPSKRYVRRTFVANEDGDRIVVRAFVAEDGEVLDRGGGRPTVKVIKRRLNLMTMGLE